jgi:hypothetical protein
MHVDRAQALGFFSQHGVKPNLVATLGGLWGKSRFGILTVIGAFDFGNEMPIH